MGVCVQPISCVLARKALLHLFLMMTVVLVLLGSGSGGTAESLFALHLRPMPLPRTLGRPTLWAWCWCRLRGWPAMQQGLRSRRCLIKFFHATGWCVGKLSHTLYRLERFGASVCVCLYVVC